MQHGAPACTRKNGLFGPGPGGSAGALATAVTRAVLADALEQLRVEAGLPGARLAREGRDDLVDRRDREARHAELGLELAQRARLAGAALLAVARDAEAPQL